MKAANLIAFLLHRKPKPVSYTPEFLPLLPKQKEIQRAMSYDRLKDVDRAAPGAYTCLVRELPATYGTPRKEVRREIPQNAFLREFV